MIPQVQFLFSFFMSRNKPIVPIKLYKIFIIIFLLCAVLHSHLSYGQVVYDNNSVTVETAGPLSFTVPAGTDRLLVVYVGAFSTGDSGTAAATFNGQSMSKAITSEDFFSVSHATSIIFYLALDDGAAITSNVTISGINSVGFIGANSYTGVDQTTPLGNTAQDIGDNNVNATSHTLSPTTSSGDLLVHFFTTASAINASLGGEATAFSGFSLGPPNQIVGGYKIATAVSHNLTTNFELAFGVWAHVAAEFNQVAAPTNTAPTIAVADFNYTAGQNSGNPVQIDGSATANDTEDNWNGGSLTVQITTNNEAGDEISIAGTNTTLSGSSVQDGATTFGTISEASGTANDGVVTNGDLLTITFNSNATDARVQALVRDIAYRSTSSTPSTSARTVTYFLSDDTEGTTETAVINVSIPLPTVTIAIEGSTSVTEDSGGTITYRFTRTGATATDLDVNYSIGGTTQNEDFTVTTDANTTYISGTRTGTITILSGSSTADLVITPLDETLIEAAETVVVKIENP